MKTLISLFSIILCLSYGKAQWVELDTGMENPPVFNDVYAITPDIVVVVGANGTILKTTDGGETWVQKPSGTTSGLGEIQFPTPDIGYITADGGTLLKTIDGGETWNVIDTESGFSLAGLSCVDENLIFISTSNNAILKTEDGGENWETIEVTLPLLSQIQFLNSDIGFLWESFGSVLSKTENGGGVWNNLTGLAAGPAHFLDEEIGFCYNGSLLKTTDGGDNFVNLGFGGAGLLFDIFVINENNVWGIIPGDLGGDPSSHGIANITSLDSENYIETIAWEHNDEIDMLSIHFSDETTGYVVGMKYNKGTIWKNGTGINTMSISENELSYNNIKIYPNPVSNKLNLVFDRPMRVDISLTDITGKQAYSITLNTNKTTINTQGFPKGAYILSVKTGDKTLTKKIIIN